MSVLKPFKTKTAHMALTDSSKFGMNEEYGKLYIGVDCFQF